MIGPAELEDIRLDLQAGVTASGAAIDDTFHPCFHPDAAMIQVHQYQPAADESPAASQPSCVSSNSSGLSIGTR